MAKRSQRDPKLDAVFKSKKFQRIFAELQERREEKRRAYRAAIDPLRSAAPLERAEGNLAYWAEQLTEWGNLEAAVYLSSRGRAVPIQPILANWRDAEQQAISRVCNDDMTFEKLVRANPTKYLSAFWNYYDTQELSIDATMLRMVDWYNIRGFEQWWKEIGDHIRQSSFSGGSHPFAIFNYCRSEYVLRKFGQDLKTSLQAIDALSPYKPAWWRNDQALGCAVHDAAAIVFSHARLGLQGSASSVIDQAVDDLRRFFDHRLGAWPAFSGAPDKLNVQATAMAVHALHLIGADDRSVFSEAACNWLWAQQHEDGYWLERAAPDPVWLTVLVLDAIQLTSGGPLTFQLSARHQSGAGPLVFVAYQHDDTEWLRLLQKHLGHLIHAGRIEFFSDREIGGGTEWDPLVKAKLMAASIIVPLISPNFLGSKYIQTIELPTAIARHRAGTTTVIPVLIDDCDWPGVNSHGFSLANLTILPKDQKNNLKPVSAWGSKRNTALRQVAARIREVVEQK